MKRGQDGGTSPQSELRCVKTTYTVMLSPGGTECCYPVSVVKTTQNQDNEAHFRKEDASKDI